MSGSPMDPRVKLSIELALTGRCNDKALSLKQDEAAKALGMTGAEVDAARRGSSFDIKTSTAVSLALNACQDNRDRAKRAGLTEACCAEIEKFSEIIRLTLSSSTDDG
jgi:hypothetical protein